MTKIYSFFWIIMRINGNLLLISKWENYIHVISVYFLNLVLIVIMNAFTKISRIYFYSHTKLALFEFIYTPNTFDTHNLTFFFCIKTNILNKFFKILIKTILKLAHHIGLRIWRQFVFVKNSIRRKWRISSPSAK